LEKDSTEATVSSPSKVSRWKAIFPPAQWVPTYEAGWLPFAGIAFLWFIGVLRDRLGELEDRFFATVFLGSGLLFLAMLFASCSSA